MGRSRYIITETNQPHFMTCTVEEWLAVFTLPETLQIIHNNPVKRGYVNLPWHWRYSSAANYEEMAGLIEIDAW